MVRVNDQCTRPVATLDRVGESVFDACVDVQVGETERRKLALDFGHERPDQPSPPVARIDEDVKEARACL